MKIWIYLKKKDTFREVDRDDPRFDWGRAYPPPKKVAFRLMKTSKDWSYVSYGDTAEECAANENQYRIVEIQRYRDLIAMLEGQMVKP